MKSLQEWKNYKENTAPSIGGEEEPADEDYQFYQTQVSGKINRYLGWLTDELEKNGQKLNTPRKGFILQEVINALGLNAAQVTRYANNIKRDIAKMASVSHQEVTPAVQPTAAPQTAFTI